MFVCEECFDPKKDRLKHCLRSRGPCEVCGKVRICYDIDIHGR